MLKRQRELPFGTKLQNHALNQRMNQEFKKYFPTCGYIPIIRVVETKRYWINENLLEIKANNKTFNIAKTVIEIVNSYIHAKRSAFDKFIETSEKLKTLKLDSADKIKKFIISLLKPNIDARIFEIVSYAVLKYYYHNQTVFLGWTLETIKEENLKLYKTGRTNANDGGIDFVMKPLGRFFQVTETTDIKKYFLDIDKLGKFPITFVIKSIKTEEELHDKIQKGATEQYKIERVVNSYMNCIEEVVNIPKLINALNIVERQNNLGNVLHEIIKQSKVEFNYPE